MPSVVALRQGRRALCSLPAAMVCLSAPGVAWSQMGFSGSSRNDASSLLTSIQQATQQRSYSGTLVYSTAEGVFSSKLARLVSGRQVWEHMESLDGPQQRVYRHNDLVHTIWPAQRVVTVERHGSIGESQGLPDLDPRLQEQYDVKVTADERVAGREARPVLLKPRDDYRFSQRVWVDRATGVLLRADVIQNSGKVLESTFFSNIDLEARLTRDQTINPAKRLDGYRTVEMIADLTSLDAEGWAVVGSLPAGFKQIGCVMRPMGDPQAQPDGKSIKVLQAVYSDGLARVSLFVEPLDPSKPRRSVATHLGATHTLRHARDDRWWVTAMGDVPLLTLKAFAESLVRKP